MQTTSAIDDALQKQSTKPSYRRGTGVVMSPKCGLDDESSKARLSSLRVFDRF